MPDILSITGLCEKIVNLMNSASSAGHTRRELVEGVPTVVPRCGPWNFMGIFRYKRRQTRTVAQSCPNNTGQGLSRFSPLPPSWFLGSIYYPSPSTLPFHIHILIALATYISFFKFTAILILTPCTQDPITLGSRHHPQPTLILIFLRLPSRPIRPNPNAHNVQSWNTLRHTPWRGDPTKAAIGWREEEEDIWS